MHAWSLLRRHYPTAQLMLPAMRLGSRGLGAVMPIYPLPTQLYTQDNPIVSSLHINCEVSQFLWNVVRYPTGLNSSVYNLPHRFPEYFTMFIPQVCNTVWIMVWQPFTEFLVERRFISSIKADLWAVLIWSTLSPDSVLHRWTRPGGNQKMSCWWGWIHPLSSQTPYYRDLSSNRSKGAILF